MTSRTSTTLTSTLAGAAAAAGLVAVLPLVPAGAQAATTQADTVQTSSARPTSTAATTRSTDAAGSTTREKGIVIECTGRLRGHEVWTSVYENSQHANVVQVVLRDGVGASRQDADGFWDGRKVLAGVRVDGHRAVVRGTATMTGTSRRVHEEHDDAGQHVEIRGRHRTLRSDLVLHHAGTATPLTCAPRFYYDLRVTRTPTA